MLPWFVLWGGISLLIGYLWRKYISERTAKGAEARAKGIIQQAENLALSKKREVDIEAKELIYRLKNEFERETRKGKKMSRYHRTDPYRDWSPSERSEHGHADERREECRRYDEDRESSDRAYAEWGSGGEFSDPNPAGRFH